MVQWVGPRRLLVAAGRGLREAHTTSNIAVPIALAVLVYTLFGAFNAQAGGRIDVALSSAIFNGMVAAFALAAVAVQRLGGTPPVALRFSGILYSVLAGVAVGVFSIVLIKIYERGGQLSYVFRLAVRLPRTKSVARARTWSMTSRQPSSGRCGCVA